MLFSIPKHRWQWDWFSGVPLHVFSKGMINHKMQDHSATHVLDTMPPETQKIICSQVNVPKPAPAGSSNVLSVSGSLFTHQQNGGSETTLFWDVTSNIPCAHFNLFCCTQCHQRDPLQPGSRHLVSPSWIGGCGWRQQVSFAWSVLSTL